MILDQGWHQILTMLEYKTNWRGGTLHKVEPKLVEKRCSSCNKVNENNIEEKGKKFKCITCGHQEGKKENRAKSILAVGLTVLA